MSFAYSKLLLDDGGEKGNAECVRCLDRVFFGVANLPIYILAGHCELVSFVRCGSQEVASAPVVDSSRVTRSGRCQ